MQRMRYLNLFSKITRVNTTKCFTYNNTIFFCVPANLISRSIGKDASNIRKLGGILNKKIKVIAAPSGIEDVKKFFQDIVEPVTYKEVSVGDDFISVSASTQSKAALIGRNKRRLLEMQRIMKDFFGKEFKII